MENGKNALCALSAKAWINSTSRFNAVRRLRRRDNFATFSIAMFSAIALGIAVSQKVFSIQPRSPIDDYLTTLAAFIGLFVLVISLIESGEQSLVKADRLEINALDLRDFMYKINFRLAAEADGGLLTQAELGQLREEYQGIIRSCPYNHNRMDYEMVRAEHRTDLRLQADEPILKLCKIKQFKPNSSISDQSGSQQPGDNSKPEMSFIRALWLQLISPLNGIGYFLLFWFVIVTLLIVSVFR